MDGTITQRMNRLYEQFEQNFSCLYTRHDLERTLRQVRRNGTNSAAMAELRKMIRAHFPEAEKMGDRQLIGLAASPDTIRSFQTDNELQERMFLEVLNNYKTFPSPEEFMKRLVDRFEDPQSGWKEDSTRLRILKQFAGPAKFLRYRDPLTNNTVSVLNGRMVLKRYAREKSGRANLPDEEVADWLDEGVFDLLKNAPREHTRPNGQLALIKTADDLGQAKFRMEGATRKSLYLFALAYGMTFEIEDRSDLSRDVEKNLFADYYTNNLMRFLQRVYQGDLRSFESLPTGQGINYKNFAEAVYLYYLHRKDLTTIEKIAGSDSMIARLKNRAQTVEEPVQTEHSGTLTYRQMLQGTPIEFGGALINAMDLPEERFEDFVFEKYSCDTAVRNSRGGIHRISDVEVETSQNGAFEEYNRLIQELNAEMKDDEMKAINWKSGLWFCDVRALNGELRSKFLERNPQISEEQFDEFTGFLLKCNEYLTDNVFQIESADEMSRTALLSAAYHYYLFLHTHPQRKSLGSFMEDFAAFMNPCLQKGGYQPLNLKNILDMLVVFSACLGQ